MIRKTLLLATFIGGVACAVTQIKRIAAQERARLKALEKEAKSSWENEGGATKAVET